MLIILLLKTESKIRQKLESINQIKVEKRSFLNGECTDELYHFKPQPGDVLKIGQLRAKSYKEYLAVQVTFQRRDVLQDTTQEVLASGFKGELLVAVPISKEYNVVPADMAALNLFEKTGRAGRDTANSVT